MKKLISVFLSVLLLFGVVPLNVFALNNAEIAIETVSAQPGETVEVNVNLANNPGIVSANFKFSFDSELTLVDAVNGDVMPPSISFIRPKQLENGGKIKNECRFVWSGFDINDSDIKDGTMIKLSFEVSDTAVPGEEYNISLSTESGDVIDKNLNSIVLNAVGKICIPSGETECKHNNTVVDEKVEATCTATGLTEGLHCADCGEILKAQEVIEKLPHTPGDIVKEGMVPTTCVSPITYDEVVYCTVCNTEISRKTITLPAPGHEGGTATCSAKAICIHCGAEYGEFDVNNHANIVTDEPVPASCTTTGLTEGAHCGDCGEIITAQEETPALGHDEGEWVITEEPSCSNEGKKERHCTRCGDLLETDTIEKLPHIPSDWIVDTEATCATVGSKHTECTVCHKVLETAEIPATGEHTEEILQGKPATCTETGLTEGAKCSVCGTVLKAQEVIEKLPHTESDAVRENEIAATCAKEGSYDEVIYCSVCDEELSRVTKTIAQLAHTPSDWIIDKAATCAAAGVKHTECTVCHEVLETAEIPATGIHTEEILPGKPATCTETGLTEGVKCSVCGTVLKAQEVIEKLPHTEADAVRENEIAATCAKEGSYDEVIYCSVCDKELSREAKTIAKLAHTPSDWIIDTAVTCAAAGAKHTECTVCHEVLESAEIPATGIHTEEILPGKAATCTATGLTDGVKCSVCGTILTEQQVIAKLPHTPSDWIVDTAATCAAVGAKHTECTVCHEVLETAEIPATGIHTEEILPGKDATCTETGLTEGKKCSVCGEVLTKQQVIDALGHKVVKDKAVAATCTDTGLTEGEHCERCNAVLKAQKVVPALPHTFGEWSVKEKATCSKNGTQVRVCTTCGKEESKVIPATGFVDSNNDGICDECGKSAEEHSGAAITNALDSIKNFMFIILEILEAVFTMLDVYVGGNGPYAELLDAVRTMKSEMANGLS